MRLAPPATSTATLPSAPSVIATAQIDGARRLVSWLHGIDDKGYGSKPVEWAQRTTSFVDAMAGAHAAALNDRTTSYGIAQAVDGAFWVGPLGAPEGKGVDFPLPFQGSDVAWHRIDSAFVGVSDGVRDFDLRDAPLTRL